MAKVGEIVNVTYLMVINEEIIEQIHQADERLEKTLKEKIRESIEGVISVESLRSITIGGFTVENIEPGPDNTLRLTVKGKFGSHERIWGPITKIIENHINS